MYLAIQVTVLILMGIITGSSFVHIWKQKTPLGVIVQLAWMVWLGWCWIGLYNIARFLNGQVSELPGITFWN